SHPPDGGLHPSSPEVKAEVERYQPKDEVTPTRIPNHLFLDTSPSQADVWVDGTLRGKTPVDLVAGPGSHRVVVIRAGYLMIQAVFDTTLGAYARRGLQRASPPHFGDAFLDVQCGIPNRYPVLLDDEETGLICPVSMLPVTSGKHTVGIFVPARRASASVEVTVPSGRQPKRVLLRE
ncbi:MAG TPA: PEGA domain-containing protein, partial [Mycobacterium sp.]|nr:PEGA domain-containing protein [Mycobacterium sp.]